MKISTESDIKKINGKIEAVKLERLRKETHTHTLLYPFVF